MDVAKVQQPNEEDPEFVRLRRAAIETLVASRISKTQRFSQQDVMKGSNVAKSFEQASRRTAPAERPTSAASVSTVPSSTTTKVTAIQANRRCKF
jgi:hypothetical protein